MFREKLVIFLILVITGLTFCHEDGGQAGGLFRWGLGSRAIGMGRAYTALATDATAGFWNPAGIADDISAYNPCELIDFKRSKSSLGYVRLFGKTNLLTFAESYNFCHSASLGITYLYLSTGGIKKWSEDNIIRETGTFDVSQHAVIVSYATRLDYWPTTDFGISLKYLANNFADFEPLRRWGMDAGFRFHPWFQPIFIGITFKNLSCQNVKSLFTKKKLNPNELPGSICFGVAKEFFKGKEIKLISGLDYEFIQDRNPSLFHFRLGFELNFLNKFYIRIGANQNEIVGGIGFSLSKNYNIDYAHGVPFNLNDLPTTGRFSVAYDGQKTETEESTKCRQMYESALTESDWKSDKSIWLYDKIISSDSKNEWKARAYLRLGDIEYEKNNLDNAFTFYEKAIQIGGTLKITFAIVDTLKQKFSANKKCYSFINYIISLFYKIGNNPLNTTILNKIKKFETTNYQYNYFDSTKIKFFFKLIEYFKSCIKDETEIVALITLRKELEHLESIELIENILFSKAMCHFAIYQNVLKRRNRAQEQKELAIVYFYKFIRLFPNSSKITISQKILKKLE